MLHLISAAYNNSMDVRAKQQLSYHVVSLTQSCVYSVSPHVNSIVRCFVVFPDTCKDVISKYQ